MSRINIEIPDSEHQKLKIIAAINSMPIKEFVLDAVREKIRIQLYKQPNDETLQAFRETDTGIGLTRHKNIKALFKDLGLDGDNQVN